MVTIRSALASLLATAIFQCFGRMEGMSWQEVCKQLEIPPRPELGDFAFPCINEPLLPDLFREDQ